MKAVAALVRRHAGCVVEPGSVRLLDDARVIHESTPIQPLGEGGYHDTWVVTLRRGGFQDLVPAHRES